MENKELNFIERKRFVILPGDKVRVSFEVKSPTWISISSADVPEVDRFFEMSIDL